MQPNSQCNLNNKYALIPLVSSRKSQKRGKREEKFVGDDKNERKSALLMTRIPPCGQRPLAVAFVQKHGQKEIQEGENPPLPCAWQRKGLFAVAG